MSSSRTGAEKQGFTTTIRSRASNMAMLARKIALTLAIGPRQMDRALALDHGLFACSASDRVWTLMNSACGSIISWTRTECCCQPVAFMMAAIVVPLAV